MNEVFLDEWATVPYPSDELLFVETPVFLSGRVHGHYKFQSGEHIRTSELTDISGNTVWSESGTRYLLGKMDETFIAWLKANKFKWDPEEPITTFEKKNFFQRLFKKKGSVK